MAQMQSQSMLQPVGQCRGLRRAFGPACVPTPRHHATCHAHTDAAAHAAAAAAADQLGAGVAGRRSALGGLCSLALAGGVLCARPAAANPLEDVARQLTRPSDITPLDAAVALLDARAILRDMAPLVASAPGSSERFNGRKMWPAYAKWLRPVGPSAPVAAALIAGTDSEATLSAQYGGTGGSSASVDAVYVALGRVLTISGRTIRDEAQFDPSLSQDAEVAIDAVIGKLPPALVEEAQQFRAARAARAGSP